MSSKESNWSIPETTYLAFQTSHGTLGVALNLLVIGITFSERLKGKDFRIFVAGVATANAFTAANRIAFRWSVYLRMYLGSLTGPVCLLKLLSGVFNVTSTAFSVHPLVLQRYLRLCKSDAEPRLMGASWKRLGWAAAPITVATLIAATFAAEPYTDMSRGDGEPCRLESGVGASGIPEKLVAAALLLHFALIIFYTARLILVLRNQNEDAGGQNPLLRKETKFIIQGCWLQTMIPLFCLIPIVVFIFVFTTAAEKRANPILQMLCSEFFNMTPIADAVAILVVMAPYRETIIDAVRRIYKKNTVSPLVTLSTY